LTFAEPVSASPNNFNGVIDLMPRGIIWTK
jgi:hypothetical protein